MMVPRVLQNLLRTALVSHGVHRRLLSLECQKGQSAAAVEAN